MPELPEVETTRRGIEPHLLNQQVVRVVVRNARLRWPIPDDLDVRLSGQRFTKIERRAKYLLLHAEVGTLICHLGMSGSLRLVPHNESIAKHDHVDIELASGQMLRYTDPRRFGAMLWTTELAAHPLLLKLGPEPLSADFEAEYLHARLQGRKQAIKPFIMDNAVVVGVGNIYASEALFAAGIDPRKAAGTLSTKHCVLLVDEIKRILAAAIEQGGTTLKDFVGGDGKPGYFQQKLFVYGRAGQPCLKCGAELKEVKLGQRSSVYCTKCQR